MADTSWLDDAPDAHWLDEAPDAPEAPRVGMGDVQASKSARVAPAKAANVPVGLLTGDSATDERIAQNFADAGYTRPISTRDVLQAGAVGASIPAGMAMGAPVAAGAISGALYSAGTSKASDAAGVALDTLKGGAVGAALPKVLEGIGAAAKPFAKWLGDKALEWGRKAVTGGYTPLSTRRALSPEAVRAAFDAGAIKPLRNSQGIAESLAGAREELGQTYADVLKQLEDRGVHGPVAEDLAQSLASKGSAAAQSSLNSPKPGILDATAEELRSKALPITGKGRLGLMQTEEMKRGLQQNAQNDFVKEGSQSISGETRMELASDVRQAIEDAVQQQSGLAPDAAARFEPVKEKLSHVIEASNAANRAAARATRLKHHSLTDELMKGSMLAHGGPAALPAALASGEVSRAVRTRGPATWAYLADKGADVAGAIPQFSASPETAAATAVAGNRALDPEARAFLDWLRARVPTARPALVGADERGGTE